MSYFRLGWSQPDELPAAEPLSQQFTQKTGIQLKSLPVPENTLDQMALSRQLLQQGGGSGPDVLGIDLIWPGLLQEYLIDLRPYLGAEISSLEPELLSSYVVDGKLLAIPYQMQVGALEYRIDLLRQYGYDHPPTTWDELERMAQRIQAGERAKGRKDFWGYVWQGAAAESLTCNALEWQVAAGGGQIIEGDRTISVNNPAAIRAWQRAKHWIGWISPPGVLAYQEQDSMNVFDSGEAAFGRVWGGATIPLSGKTRLDHRRGSPLDTVTGYASIPGGGGGRVGTLGGSGLAVSAHSLHPQEAIELVRFLVRAQIQSSNNKAGATLAAQPDALEVPSIADRHGRPGSFHQKESQSGVARRPSDVSGRAYEQVAKAYMVEGEPQSLHAVIRDEVYSIGREAVVNSFRHSGAAKITVELHYSASQLRVVVCDDGCGIDQQVLEAGRVGHWGLSGMRERAQRIGATLKLGSRNPTGTEVELSVPGNIAFVSSRLASKRFPSMVDRPITAKQPWPKPPAG